MSGSEVLDSKYNGMPLLTLNLRTADFSVFRQWIMLGKQWLRDYSRY